ncbi:MAG: SUMF1/EgtB/PvdO family nonheme iron enzyme, partial [Desulfovibrionaceae bacterium]|nr:SUMF1/EgtB/PvdO family nonheme iron enzyme [Desulfovibrionaceae bacterium]
DGFLLLPGGTFMMGSPQGERQRNQDEVRHEVSVSSFYVDPYEVTQEDYEALRGENPSFHKGAKFPVENVTWLDCIKYCNALSEKRGLTPVYKIRGEEVSFDRKANGYRLLTEAEWEYAARAGTSSVFNVGDQVEGDKINFEGSYPYGIEENYVNPHDPSVKPGRFRGKTMEVQSLKPNAFGLYHTHGNVSEWVFDYYGPYDLKRSKDPWGPGFGTYRVNRGGSFLDFGKHLRSAYRSATNPLDPDPNLGFRIARNATPLEEVVETKAPFRLEVPDNPKVLVAYFSYSGNTRRAAKMMSEILKADLFEIRMQKPYRGNIYEVSQLDLNQGIRPKLTSKVDNFASYQVILLGYPTWWATMPMPVLSFLEAHDFKGKIVLPFSSHGGTVFGDSVSDLSKAIQGAYVGIGFEFNYCGGRDLEKRIRAWLKMSGFEK